MKRVLFLVSSMQSGGAERVAALLCNYWAKQGYEVMLVPTFSGRGDCVFALDKKVRLQYLADRAPRGGKSLMSQFHRFRALRQLIREYRPHAVLSFLSNVNVAAILTTLGMGIPVVVSERSFPPSMPVGRFWARMRIWTYPNATCVVMQTDKGKAWLDRAIPKAKGTVIANPCVFPLPVSEPRLVPERFIASDRKVLLAVGRLSPEKGFDRLIDAFGSLADRFSGWDLVILGEGPERDRLEQKITDQGLLGRVHLPGHAGNASEWYGRARLYVLSSHFEGFPNTLMEALAHGVPAVSIDCDTGPAELVEHRVNGLLVPPDAGTPGLATALSELMGDDALRNAMAGRAVEVRERFSMERIAEKWARALRLLDVGDACA